MTLLDLAKKRGIQPAGVSNTSNGFPTEEPSHVKRSFGQQLGRFVTGFGQGAQDLAVGVAKGVVGSVKGLADLGEGGLNAISNKLGVKDKTNAGPSTSIIPEATYTTQNLTEKIGYGLEQIAELAIPIGGAEKVIGKASERIGQSLPKITELIKPILTKAEEQAAKEAGKTATKGIFKNVVLKTTPYDLNVAKVAQEAGVDASKSFDKNIVKINNALSQHTNEIKSALEQGGASFTTNEFKGALNKIKPPVLITSDATLKNAYKLVKEQAVKIVKDIPEKTKANLFDARIEFDQFIQRQFPDLYKNEKLTPMRSAIKDIRNAWNDTIAKGYDEYKQILSKESMLFDARESIAAKAPRLGENILSKTSKSKTGKAIRYGLETIGGYEIAKKVLGK